MEGRVKRIAMLSVHTCPLAELGGEVTGGMNVYVRELSRELGRQGIQVDVFTRAQVSGLPTVVPLGEGCRVVHIPAGPRRPCRKDLIQPLLPQFVEGVKAFAASEGLRYELLHAHYWLSGEAGLSLAREWGVPLAQMFHTLERLKNLALRKGNGRVSRQRIALEEFIVQGAEHLVASTPVDRAHMIWHYGALPEKISVIPCGVDLNLFRPQGREESKRSLGLEGKKVILFVGRLEPIKGLDILLKGVAGLLNRSPQERGELRLLIVGGGLRINSKSEPSREPLRVAEPWEYAGTQQREEVRRLKAMAEGLGLNGQVLFLGSRPQAQLPRYYSAADLFVLPSHYESFGMAALEAMACGAPVVASRAGGLSCIVKEGHSGLLVPNGNPEALAAAMGTLLSRRELRLELGWQGAREALAFGWPRVTAQMVALYSALSRNSRAGERRGDALGLNPLGRKAKACGRV